MKASIDLFSLRGVVHLLSLSGLFYLALLSATNDDNITTITEWIRLIFILFLYLISFTIAITSTNEDL